MKRRSIGIFAGSFNPIHVGHLILANYMKEFTYLDEVWFVVTPQNPLKDPAGLLDDKVRLEWFALQSRIWKVLEYRISNSALGLLIP